MRYIYAIDRKDNLKDELCDVFKNEKGIRVKKFLPEQFEIVLKNIPDILLINEDELNEKENTIEFCKAIRSDENNTITPIIIVSSNTEKKHIIEVLKNDVELYLQKPIDKEILYYSIKNIMRLLNSNRTVSPLTGLLVMYKYKLK